MFGCNPSNDQIAVFRGNLERTGVYDTGSKMPLGELKWKYNTETDYLSSPIISEGVVYVTGAGGYLFAVNASTGEKKWMFQGEKWAGTTPALSKSTVYFGSMDNSVYAVDIKNGQEKWRFTTGDYVFSSPAVSDKFVYFGSYDGYFYAVDINMGQQKWSFKTQGAKTLTKPAGDYDLIGSVRSSAAIFQNNVYFGSYDGYLYALDANTGKEKWNFKTDDVIFNSTPSVSDGVIYFVNEAGNLYAVDSNGKEKWRFSTRDFLTIPAQATQIRVHRVSSPTIADGFIYL
jgi:eukaryotic-like serine/threonine-protein kinase